ncbi:SMP-30/gluconolactonase/LRE family protein [Streptomyces sp. NPDC048179]|uniref:SMP-30/gluconolactonase/LRE family protein n=1 Tax=Streptomyces sp. NPDC048179 TaxID=3365506 RepID=UPI00372275FA
MGYTGQLTDRTEGPHVPHPLSRRRLLTLGTATLGALAIAPHAQAAPPTSIALPNGWQPEGITIGAGPYAYLGSLADGSLYRADLRTGTGKVISTGPGTPAVGLKLDARGRLFVAARSYGARVVDARSGETLATYALATATPTFANDVVLTPRAAWFTESYQPVLYGLPLGRNGELPDAADVVRLPLTGDWAQTADGAINANGIARTPDGSALLVVQAGVGLLHRVDPGTGVTTVVDLGDAAPLTNGDGLLLRGRTLYVVQNRQNAIDVFALAPDGRTGVFRRRITDPAFDVPTTVAAYGGRLYLPNARFTTTPTSDTTYSVTAVDA